MISVLVRRDTRASLACTHSPHLHAPRKDQLDTSVRRQQSTAPEELLPDTKPAGNLDLGLPVSRNMRKLISDV